MQNKTIEIAVRTLISLAILGGSVAGALHLKSFWKVNQKGKPDKSNDLLVEVAPVTAHEGPIQFDVSGEVIPYREIMIAAEVAGRAVFVSPNCHVGRYVKQGETLVKIYRRDYEIELARLKAMKLQADSNLAEISVEEENINAQEEIAQSTLELQQRELDRYEDKTAEGVFSPAQIDAARRSVLAAKTTLQNLTNQRRTIEAKRKQLIAAQEVAQAQLDQAELNLERTEITAPISGIVTKDDIEKDGYLQRGGPIATIQDLQTMEIRSSLYMKHIYWLWGSVRTPEEEFNESLKDPQTRYDVVNNNGESYSVITLPAAESDNDAAAINQKPEPSDAPASNPIPSFPTTPVEVIYELAGHSYVWDGMLESYDGASIDPRTRMLPVRVLITDPMSGRPMPSETAEPTPPATASKKASAIKIPSLMVGMFVKVRIRVKPKLSFLEIPEKALLPGGEIWVVDKDKKLRKKIVSVAHSDLNNVLVYEEGSGMQPGDQVVISPMAAPINGTPVKLVGDAPKDKSPPEEMAESPTEPSEPTSEPDPNA